MSKLLKGAIVGAAAGAAVAAVRSYRRDDPVEVLGKQVAKVAAGAALAGAFVGGVLDARSRRSRRRRSGVLGAIPAATVLEVAKTARPVIEQVAEAMKEKAEAQKPRVEKAASDAVHRARRAADHKRPRLDAFVNATRTCAAELRGTAKSTTKHASRAAKPKAKAVAERAGKKASAARDGARSARARRSSSTNGHVEKDESDKRTHEASEAQTATGERRLVVEMR